MIIRNYFNPPVGNSKDERTVIRKTYRAFRTAGYSPMVSRSFLRALFTMGESRGLDRLLKTGFTDGN